MKTGILEIVVLVISLLPVAPHASANSWPNVLISNKEPVGVVTLFLPSTSATM